MRSLTDHRFILLTSTHLNLRGVEIYLKGGRIFLRTPARFAAALAERRSRPALPPGPAALPPGAGAGAESPADTGRISGNVMLGNRRSVSRLEEDWRADGCDHDRVCHAHGARICMGTYARTHRHMRLRPNDNLHSTLTEGHLASVPPMRAEGADVRCHRLKRCTS
jgi:hypothetical protein